MSTTKERPRIGGFEWRRQRPAALAVFDARYDEDGNRGTWEGDRPWTVIGSTQAGDIWEEFDTHTEAVAYAFKEAGK